MAQYYTDFSEYTTGQHPAGWTQRRDEATSWSVEADAGATGGKVLRFPGKAANTQSILTWDAIDSDSGRATVEILLRYRYGGTSASLYAWARDASTSSAATGYRMGDSYTATTIGIIGKYVSGSYSNIYTAGGGAINATNTWAYIRAQVSGNSLRVRVWKDGNAEPNTWSGTGTDNSLSTGRVGIMIFNTAPVDIDWIGIGTGGDPAPDSPVDPGGDHYEDAFALDLTAGIGAAGAGAAVGSLTLDIEPAVGAGGSASLAGAISMGIATGLANGGAGAAADVATLALSAGMAPGGMSTAVSALAFGIGLGLTYSDGATQQYEDALDIGFVLDMASAAAASAQGEVVLSLQATVSVEGAAAAVATISVALATDLLGVAAADLAAAIALGVEVGQAVAASVGEMTVPDARVFRVGRDRRQIEIRRAGRVITVTADIRRFDA